MDLINMGDHGLECVCLIDFSVLTMVAVIRVSKASSLLMYVVLSDPRLRKIACDFLDRFKVM